MQAPAATAAAENLKHTVWRDDTFFTQFPLNVHTVIDYFSRSPFYDHRCNNEECKRQGLPLDHLRCDVPAHHVSLQNAASAMCVDCRSMYALSIMRGNAWCHIPELDSHTYQLNPTMHGVQAYATRPGVCSILRNRANIVRHQVPAPKQPRIGHSKSLLLCAAWVHI